MAHVELSRIIVDNNTSAVYATADATKLENGYRVSFAVMGSRTTMFLDNDQFNQLKGFCHALLDM